MSEITCNAKPYMYDDLLYCMIMLPQRTINESNCPQSRINKTIGCNENETYLSNPLQNASPTIPEFSGAEVTEAVENKTMGTRISSNGKSVVSSPSKSNLLVLHIPVTISAR